MPPRARGGGQGGRAAKPGSARKGSTTGSGGQRRRGLEGKGPTPKAEERTGHPAARRSASAARRAASGDRDPAAGRGRSGRGQSSRGQGGRGQTGRAQGGPGQGGRGQSSRGGRGQGGRGDEGLELLVGRNPVVEALRARVPATALHIALGLEADDRVTEAVRLASDRGIALLEVPRSDLDRRAAGAPHQGLALQVPPYAYAHPDDLLARALDSGTAPLLVALDGVTDPRNLGAVVRSALAFGAHGVVVPERRSAGLTAVAWRASAGAAARLPVARATNLVRTLVAYRKAGLLVAGLDADGSVTLDDLEVARDPLVVVVGSEGRGLSRLVGDTCDLTVGVPMAAGAESLNASVAAAVTLSEIARRRRTRTVTD